MNKPFFKTKIIALFLAAGIVVTSCSDDDSNNQRTTEITQQEVLKNIKIEEISNFIDGMTMNNLSLNRSNPSLFSKNVNNDCFVFEATQNGYTLSFSECDLGDGIIVNGSMSVVVTVNDNAVTSTITFNNLNYGGNQINGTKSSIYSLNTTGGSLSYSVTSNLSINLADGSTASENGTKTYEIDGLGTAEASYTISGSWNITVNEDSYTLIADPSLQGSFDCEYIKAGILTLTKNGLSAQVDYGDGTCDNKATIIYPDGTEVEIEL